MYSSKNTMDFMSELNRLFPNTLENAQPQLFSAQNTRLPTAFNSPIFSHPIMANQSSSSADSTSPESYPDLTAPRCETPSLYRRQRPIVGRKIIPTEPRIVESPLPFENFNFNRNWTPNTTEENSLYSLTPPNYQQRDRYAQNEYELFPTEKKPLEFQTPVKNPSKQMGSPLNVSPSSSYSPSMSNYSPCITYSTSPNLNSTSFSNFGQGNYTNSRQFRELPRNPQANFSGFPPAQNFLQQSLQYAETPRSGKICTFCRKNGERPAIYMNHSLKERVNNRTVVQCPILRKLVCITCGATGDDAHTNTYCPLQRSLNNGEPLQSTTIILKNTRVKSNGRRRY